MAKAKTSNILVWILLGLLIVSLLGFGVTNFGGNVRTVATVGETEIEIDRYGRELQNELRAIAAQSGSAVSFAQARDLGIDRAVLSRLVAQAALENEAARLGLSVGDEVVASEIQNVPAFRGADGGFNREAYQFTLENSGLTVAEFEERVRAESASGLVQTGIVSSVAAPRTYVSTLVAYALERRDITWARMTPEDLELILADPTDAQLAAFHEENADLFTLPETRMITYALLTPEMMIDTIEIDRTALEQRYQDRIEEFVIPERRLVERLVYGSETEAAAALSAIEAGETSFDAEVAARGLDLADVDLGDVTETDLGEAGAAVFALAEPGVTGPHPTSLGPALFRMNGILAARETSLEEAEPDLRDELATDRARRVIDESITDIDDLLAGGATLEELAAETEMELGQIGWRDGVDEDIAGYEGFREAAARARVDDFPEVLTLEDGGIFALRLDEIRPPMLQPLDEIRDEVAEAWRLDQTTEALRAEAQALAGQIANGREMAGIDLALETDRGLTREAFVSGAVPGLVAEVFEMAPDELRVIDGAGEVFIVRLDAIRPADPADPDVARVQEALGQQARQGIANDVLTAYTNALIDAAGVEVNQNALNAIHAQFQ